MGVEGKPAVRPWSTAELLICVPPTLGFSNFDHSRDAGGLLFRDGVFQTEDGAPLWNQCPHRQTCQHRDLDSSASIAASSKCLWFKSRGLWYLL